ncbi:hypothetical protein [Pseudomonas guariconensis]|uniref:hypothetical protein n=1 Tax=Pseudomonas guariconensis TaxID=1288410 RepID=UPI0018AC6438|nr:hypothetical protein [Pseudomonas guariconensis]MBF8724300.1 hypothetical protein [Pseudomonas guariconensis]
MTIANEGVKNFYDAFSGSYKRLHLRLNEQGLIDLQIWMTGLNTDSATSSSACLAG